MSKTQSYTKIRSIEMDKGSIVREKFARALWNERRFDTASEIFTDDFFTQSIAFQPSNWLDIHGRGPESMIHHIKWWLNILPDAKLHILETAQSEDLVIFMWELAGTFRGNLLGRAPTHRPIRILGSAVAIFEGNKIKMHRTLLDKFGLLQQIGAI